MSDFPLTQCPKCGNTNLVAVVVPPAPDSSNGNITTNTSSAQVFCGRPSCDWNCPLEDVEEEQDDG
jgi:hypothetical protein